MTCIKQPLVYNGQMDAGPMTIIIEVSLSDRQTSEIALCKHMFNGDGTVERVTR